LDILEALIQKAGVNNNVAVNQESYSVLSMPQIESCTTLQILEIFNRSDIQIVPHHTYSVPEFSAETCQSLGIDIYEHREVYGATVSLIMYIY
jgi:uncharacterized protein YecA (UPF0149 family)